MTFPDVFEEISRDSNIFCEIFTTDTIQKSKMFYQENEVTNFDFNHSNPSQKITNGKVLIIVNEFVENRFSGSLGI